MRYISILLILITSFQLILGQADSLNGADSSDSILTEKLIEDSLSHFSKINFPLSKEILEPITIDSNFFSVYKENSDFAYIKEINERNILLEFWDQFIDFISSIFKISNKVGLSKILKYLFIGLGIYLFVTAVMKGTGISFFVKKDDSIPLVLQGLPQVKDASDLESQLRQAVDSSDFKKAIQLIYIKTLMNLNQEERIKLQAAKTNLHYIFEMQSDHSLESFKKLTSEFEFVQYGDFEATEEKYKIVDQLFQSINAKEL